MQQLRYMYSCNRCKQQHLMYDDAGELNYFRCIVCDAIVCAECVGINGDDDDENNTTCVCYQCVKDGY